MSSFVPPQRRPAKPSDSFAASVDERSPRTSAALPDPESITAIPAAPGLRDLAPAARHPLTPIPVLRPDGDASAGSSSHRRESPAPAARHAASFAEEHSDGAAQDAGPVVASGIAQARVSVRQVGCRVAGAGYAEGENPIQRKNVTGLPDALKEGVEALSGIALDDVRVHYNSAKPAAVRALAYTQGAEIHVGPGQERHLPHEAWHVVQQMQRRVKPTLQPKGVAINDDRALEKEADVMGAEAVRSTTRPAPNLRKPLAPSSAATIQRANMILDLGDADLARSLASASAHLGLVPVPFDTADLKGVNAGETVTILGHGSAALFKYDADTFAKMLAAKGLKDGVHIVLSGCHTGKDFLGVLTFSLKFAYSITPGSITAPTTLGTTHASGALAAADEKTDAVKVSLYTKLGEQQRLAQFDPLDGLASAMSETKGQLNAISATQDRLRTPAVIEAEMRTERDAGRLIDLTIELEKARKVWKTT